MILDCQLEPVVHLFNFKWACKSSNLTKNHVSDLKYWVTNMCKVKFSWYELLDEFFFFFSTKYYYKESCVISCWNGSDLMHSSFWRCWGIKGWCLLETQYKEACLSLWFVWYNLQYQMEWNLLQEFPPGKFLQLR